MNVPSIDLCFFSYSECELKGELEGELKKVKYDLETDLEHLKTELEDTKDKLEEDIGKQFQTCSI